jgi:adenine-specific DNA-methyltransferase
MNDELELFKKDFNEEELKKFLIEKFLPDDFQKNEQELDISKYNFEKIKKVKYIGNSQNPEIHFYIIEHSGIQDPRVAITRETFKIIRDYYHKNTITLYYTQNSPNYRLSLLTIDIFPKTETRVGEVFSNPRRFSYFLGPDSKVKTPTQQIILKGKIKDLDDLKERFSLEVVTKQFYNELQNWYYWAIDKVHFPENNDIKENPKNSTNLIRLITRLMFVWFLKEKKLVPEYLFNEEDLKNIVKDFYKNKSSTNYYNAILQNLFFATLNRPINERKFAKDEGFIKNRNDYGIRNLYRYENMFLISEEKVIDLFSSIPFVNGGLFDCLDDDMDIKSSAIDGFTRNDKYRAKIPDYLFFQKEEQEVDLSKYLEKAKKAKVRGLIEILKTYHFTTDENTSIDQDISLDPEMLGKVFENLLAAYNPETSETARKSSGSYYTPREIVDYMVDESLINYIKTKLPEISEKKIRSLFSYTEEKVEFSDKEKNDLIEIIDNIKIIDPACGSGAFPMGVLHKLVLALEKIDPDNKLWQEKQYKKILDHYKEIEKSKDSDKEEVLKELNETFDETLNNPNYARKLYVIENSIYGVDIQPIAVQISKLRFFISLLIEQKTNSDKGKNYGIRPLPNLETKFVIANTLIGLEKLPDELFVSDIQKIIDELFKIREDFFYANSRHKKKKLEGKEQKLKEKLIESIQKNSEKINKEKIQKLKIEIEKLNKELDNLASQPDEIEIIEIPNLFGEKEIKKINKTKEKRKKIKGKKIIYENEIRKLESSGKEQTIEIAKKIADFNPYDQNKSNTWFDPEWMFGIKDGFDIVIGNPPYIQLQKAANDKYKFADFYKDQGYETFERTGDIYCLFYEKGIQLLKENGFLSYITSNKWMRAGYGEKLREFFIRHNPIILIDLGPGVFENATVDTNILIIQKSNNKNKLKAITLKEEDKNNIYNSIKQKSVILDKLSSDAWFIGSNEEQKLKEKIEKIGKPLKDWDVKIYYGIKTGLNDAFIIDNKKREEILKNCKDKEERKRTEAIIKPILRGRDIKRYYYEWAGLWVITIPAGWTNENRGKEKPEIFIKKTFPSLMEHLKEFETNAKKRDDQGDYWWELRHCAYYPEFESEKIIYSEIVREPQFYLDRDKFYVEATNFLLTGNNLRYLCGLLNSEPVTFFFKKYYAGGGLGDEGYRYKKAFLENLPIPPITSSNESIVHQIESLVDKILESKKQNPNADIKELENQIDQLVYQLYNLTPDEIKIIEGEKNEKVF